MRYRFACGLSISLVLLLAACSSSVPPETDPTPPVSVYTESFDSNRSTTVSPTIDPTPSVSVYTESTGSFLDDPYTVITSDDVPEPVIQSSSTKYLFYFKPAEDADYSKGAVLYRSGKDGKNEKIIDVTSEPMTCVEYENCVFGNDDWIYYTTDTAMYKIKTNRTGKTRMSDSPALRITVIGDKGFYTLKDEGSQIHEISDNTIKSYEVEGHPTYILYDEGTIYYIFQLYDYGLHEIYAFDTALLEDRLLFSEFSTYDRGMIAEQGKLYFVDGDVVLGSPSDEGTEISAGSIPAIVSFDTKTNEKRTVVELPEAEGLIVDNLTRYGPYFIYTTWNIEGGEMPDTQITLWAYETQTGIKYRLADMRNQSGYPDVNVSNGNLFIERFQVVFSQGLVGLKETD